MGQAWKAIGLFILKQRVAIVIAIVALTVLMGFFVRPELTYDFAQIIPADDPDYIEYVNFKKKFGEDGNAVVICYEGDIFRKDFLNGMRDLRDTLEAIPDVEQVVGIMTLFDIVAEPDSERFRLDPLMPGPLQSDADAAALRTRIDKLPFYKGLILNAAGDATLMAVRMSDSSLRSSRKNPLVREIHKTCSAFAEKRQVKMHISGLPYIRAVTMDTIKREMLIFLALAVFVTAVSIFFFFRSLVAVAIPLLIVVIVTIWTLAVMWLFGYKITVLSCVLPSLITVIGIPNAIYLLTKYHFEYRRTRGKALALVHVIQKIGIVTVITNLNTAAGFLVLGLSNVKLMKEFGIVAGISVTVTFFVSILLIPIILSYVPPPSPRDTKHIEGKRMNGLIAWMDRIVQHHRPWIYVGSFITFGLSIWGIMKLQTVSFLVDDIPHSNSLHADLHYLEENFGGVLPFEIVVNTHRKLGITKQGTMRKLEQVEEKLASYPEISRAVSVVDLMKFGRQAFLSGVPTEYQLPSKEELTEIQLWAKHSNMQAVLGAQTVYDSTYAIARIKASIRDMGSIRLKEVLKEIGAELDSLFVVNQDSLEQGENYRLFGSEDFSVKYAGKTYANGEYFTAGADSKYEVLAGSGKVDFQDRITLTGTTKIFTKSNDYLINNLLQNMVLALVVIALMMFPLFGTARMMFISVVPNILPLVITTGIMGFAGIPLKPSTALIYSMSFGIAIDNTIHFLARYRLARKAGDGVRQAVTNSFEDTGLSMIYTSVILFMGFVIFAFSSYGGTVALGQLTSISLLIALVTNLFLLPAMLITFQKDTDKVDEPMIEFDEEEEEDIEAMKELVDSVEETGAIENENQVP